MEQYKKILSNKLFQGSQLSNFQLNTFLSQDNRPLPLGQLDVLVNEYEQFTKERNLSTCYRLSGILRGLFTNVLFNVTGDRSYETVLSLKDQTGRNNPNRKFFYNFGYGDIILETDGWLFIRDPARACHPKCEDIDLRPVPNDFYFLPLPMSGLTMIDPLGNPRQNWFFKLTYPKFTACTSIYFQSPFVSGPPGQVTLCDGIVINNITGGTLNGRAATLIQTPINHGLIEGDKIIVRPFSTTVAEKILDVLSVDDENNFWVNYYDNNYQTNIIRNSTVSGNPLRFKRIIFGIESQYFVRTFTAITEIKDYQLYNAGFSNNIFNDPIQLYHYNLDIDTSPYRDYLNRPLSEVYLTKIKYTNPNVFPDMETWTDLAVGLLTNNRCGFYEVRSIIGGTQLNPYSSFPPTMTLSTVTENNTSFFGDIVDYNEGDLTERVLEVPYYRFNTVNREDNLYPEGYYYLAHDKIQLLEFSSQVEQENRALPDVDIPDYAVTINGLKQWRDLLTPGFFEVADRGVDYPFLNGCTYIFTEHTICLKRQNPEQLQFCVTGTTNGTPYNYWLSGINCEKEYGEYIEPIDGEC